MKKILTLLLTLVVLLSLSACGKKQKEYDLWPTYGLATMLPAPDTEKIKVYDYSSSISIDIDVDSPDAFSSYVERCEEAGWTVEAERKADAYSAFNAEGYKLDINFFQAMGQLSIHLYEPKAKEPIVWPTIGLATLIPTPDSTIGSMESNSSSQFSAYIGEISPEDYAVYVNECMNLGFSVDFNSTERSFSAGNADGVSLRLTYEGFNTMYVKITAPENAESANTAAPSETSSIEETESTTEVTIKESPDKYTWYIKDYVGQNLSAVGYTSMGGDRMDSYGSGYIALILLPPNGEYIDIRNQDELEKWYVIGQSLEPNTEIKYSFQVDSNGEEYDNLIACQNIEEIVLALAPVDGDAELPQMTAINTNANRYTSYVRDYVGRNLTQCGYTSMGGDRMDSYGHSYVRLALRTTNGEFVDIHEEDSIKNWVVVAQSINPNTEIHFSYTLDTEGKEYENLISYQSVEEIVLAVAPIGEVIEIPAITIINTTPDRYTAYVYDYVGRTLDQCGYVSMGGKLMQQYNAAYVELLVCTEDGSYVDISDDTALRNYVVVGQSIVPNTEIKMTYCTDSNGNEYDNLVDTQNIEEVELYVVPVG